MDIARHIDHTLLKPEATIQDVIKLCEEAITYSFAAVCVNPVYVALAANRLAGTEVRVATVVGFPLGASLPAIKVMETRQAVVDKADEIDMVMHIAAAKMGQWQVVEEDIRRIVETAGGRIVKVIIETALLAEDEKILACETIMKTGAHFIKTSTGFAKLGADEKDIKLFKKIVGDRLKIKASGGIRNRQQAEAMLLAGADRLGTSAGVQIVLE